MRNRQSYTPTSFVVLLLYGHWFRGNFYPFFFLRQSTPPGTPPLLPSHRPSWLSDNCPISLLGHVFVHERLLPAFVSGHTPATPSPLLRYCLRSCTAPTRLAKFPRLCLCLCPLIRPPAAPQISLATWFSRLLPQRVVRLGASLTNPALQRPRALDVRSALLNRQTDQDDFRSCEWH